MNMAIVLLIAFVAAIAIGFIFNINQGVVAMVMSYVMGCFVMGLKPSALTAMWPIKIFFILMTVSLFYNFATLNGTMDKLAVNILHKFGKQAKLFPFVAFIVAWLMSAMGAGPYSVIFLLCPILFAICDKINMSKLLLGLGALFGAVSGGPFPACATGAVINGIVSDIGYADQATAYSFIILISATLSFFSVYLFLYFFVFKAYKTDAGNIQIEKPEPYDEKQKKSLMLIGLFLVMLLVPYILNMIVKNPVITILVKYNDVGFIALILAAISTVLKLAEEKKAITMIPWNTIIMVGGISMIVGLAVEAGTIDMLVDAVNSIENVSLVTGFTSGIAGIMSLFSSSTGVVIPTLFPMIPKISAATGIAPGLLMAAINTGTSFTSMSPMSACGALLMGCVSEKESGTIYKQLFMVAGCMLVVTTVLYTVISMLFL